MTNYTSVVDIPAYDACHNGLVIQLSLSATLNNNFSITTHGVIAEALHRNFKRIIEIMSSINSAWHCLELISYVITSESNHFIVKDSRSSSMALCIALLDIYRMLHGKNRIAGLTGTGILRIDGSFDHPHLIEKKYLAAQQNIKQLTKFITPNECKNLFELENIIEDLSVFY